MTVSLKEKLVQACLYIEGAENLPTLSKTALKIGMSPVYFQKVFTRALGISPRHYADAVRFNRLREYLKKGKGVSRALYDAGFGGSSRLYEFSARYLGMTPGAYQKKGKGTVILYTVARSPLGFLLLAATEKGMCSVRLGSDKRKLETELKKEFLAAKFIPNDSRLEKWTQALVDYLSGYKPWPLLPYDVRATAFQRRVWTWLRAIPAGTTCHYSEVAEALGCPGAARAVARACASNPVALVIPCHRIVPKSGGVGGYRWSSHRKKRLLKIEKPH